MNKPENTPGDDEAFGFEIRPSDFEDNISDEMALERLEIQVRFEKKVTEFINILELLGETLDPEDEFAFAIKHSTILTLAGQLLMDEVAYEYATRGEGEFHDPTPSKQRTLVDLMLDDFGDPWLQLVDVHFKGEGIAGIDDNRLAELIFENQERKAKQHINNETFFSRLFHRIDDALTDVENAMITEAAYCVQIELIRDKITDTDLANIEEELRLRFLGTDLQKYVPEFMKTARWWIQRPKI